MAFMMSQQEHSCAYDLRILLTILEHANVYAAKQTQIGTRGKTLEGAVTLGGLWGQDRHHGQPSIMLFTRKAWILCLV